MIMIKYQDQCPLSRSLGFRIKNCDQRYGWQILNQRSGSGSWWQCENSAAADDAFYQGLSAAAWQWSESRGGKYLVSGAANPGKRRCCCCKRQKAILPRLTASCRRGNAGVVAPFPAWGHHQKYRRPGIHYKLIPKRMWIHAKPLNLGGYVSKKETFGCWVSSGTGYSKKLLWELVTGGPQRFSHKVLKGTREYIKKYFTRKKMQDKNVRTRELSPGR